MFLFLTVLQAIVAAALVGVILMQRSEGGGLGIGGSPAGLMSARGAADFLSRATTVLAIAFVVLSIVLAALAVDLTTGREIESTLNRSTPAAQQAPSQPADPLGEAAAPSTPVASPAPVSDDPLAGQAQ